jgi:hypothetical protein
MNGPSDDLRASIFEIMEGTGDASDTRAEGILTEALDRIDLQAAEDLAEGWDDLLSEDAALQTLSAVEAWTGLASAAVARLYAPASPWPRRQFAGWAQSIAQRLRALAQRLGTVLRAVAHSLGAVSWSIGLAFPFGISVSLTWQ